MNPLARRRLRFLCAVLGTIAVVGVGIRAFIGPFQIWPTRLRVDSPFALENIFWIAIFGFLTVAWSGSKWCDRGPQKGASLHARMACLFAVAVLVTLAFSPNLRDPFLSDDYVILHHAAFDTPALLASLRTPGGDGAFRPLGNLYYAVVYKFAGYSPLAWHLCSLAIHLINTTLVFSIAWRLWRDAAMALAASLLFGLHGTRPEVVVWMAGSFDLLACLCVLLCVFIALLTEKAAASMWHFAVFFLCAAAGILCKESAYAMPFVAAGILWPALRAEKLRGFLIAGVGACTALFAYRLYLFGGPGGYIDSATGQPQVLSGTLLLSMKALVSRVWTVFLVPNNWDSCLPVSAAIAIPLGMAALLAVAMMASVHSRTVWIRLGLILATSLAVLPAVHLALIGDSELGSRILYVPSITFALLIGSLLDRARRRQIVLTGLALLGAAGTLEHNLKTWHNVAVQAQEACIAAAHGSNSSGSQPLPVEKDGVFFFRNGLAECEQLVRDGRVHR